MISRRRFILAAAVAATPAAALTAFTPFAARTALPVNPPADRLADAATDTLTAAPSHWAQPVDERWRLYRVAPDMYRSALPDAHALALLHALGITTVVNFYQQSDRVWLPESASIEAVHLPLRLGHIDDADVIRVLHTIRTAQTRGAVLLHCHHGVNRTGLIAALWRIVYQGWPEAEALAEMRSFGAGRRMENAQSYLARVDFTALRLALATGHCTTRRLAWCQVAQWWAGL